MDGPGPPASNRKAHQIEAQVHLVTNRRAHDLASAPGWVAYHGHRDLEVLDCDHLGDQVSNNAYLIDVERARVGFDSGHQGCLLWSRPIIMGGGKKKVLNTGTIGALTVGAGGGSGG